MTAARPTTAPDTDGARGSLDATAAAKLSSRDDRRLYVVSLRFTAQEMHMLRAAVTAEHPTVTEVIRSRVFLPRLSPPR
jgi:hypothetical protein